MSGQEQEATSKSASADPPVSTPSGTIDFAQELETEAHPLELKNQTAPDALNALSADSGEINASGALALADVEVSPDSAHESSVEYVAPPLMNPDEVDGEGKIMSVVDHLDELRNRLIRTLLVFVLAMGVTFAFGKEIIQFLEKPAGKMTFQALSIEEPLLVYCKVAFYAALVLVADRKSVV